MTRDTALTTKPQNKTYFLSFILAVMYKTNYEIACAILKGKLQNDVYCGIVHYPFEKKLIVVVFLCLHYELITSPGGCCVEAAN